MDLTEHPTSRHRDLFWICFGINAYTHPYPLECPGHNMMLIGSRGCLVGRGCIHCGWLDKWGRVEEYEKAS